MANNTLLRLLINESYANRGTKATRFCDCWLLALSVRYRLAQPTFTNTRNILAAIYFIRGLGFFALLLVGTHWELYIAATIGGIVWAGSIATSSAILADVYGVRLVGVMYGTAYLGHQVGAMISSWLGGWGYEHFGTHWVAFGSSGVLLMFAAVVSLKLPLPGFRLAQPLAVARA